jgi:hypothetical protein
MEAQVAGLFLRAPSPTCHRGSTVNARSRKRVRVAAREYGADDQADDDNHQPQRYEASSQPAVPAEEDLRRTEECILKLTSNLIWNSTISDDAWIQDFLHQVQGKSWKQLQREIFMTNSLANLASRCQISEALDNYSEFQLILSELFFCAKINRSVNLFLQSD